MKKNNKQTTDPWSSKKTIYAAVIIIILLATFSLFTNTITISPEGKFTQTASCYDSDNLDFDTKGILIITQGNDIIMSKTDECINNKLMEYTCNPENSSTYLSTLEHCECWDGRCVG